MPVMTIEARALTRAQVISELTRSPHGNLADYLPVGSRAAREDADFFAHLVAWNHEKGQVRDAKVALPVIALGATRYHAYTGNALAHMASLDPRNLVRALRFAKEAGTAGNGRHIRRVVEMYLRAREQSWPWWERAAVQHRESMKTLYAMSHIKPSAMADAVLFKGKYPADSLFDVVARLPKMPVREAASAIITRRIPFLVATGALGGRAKDPDLLLALIEQMSPNELVNSMAMLKKLGVENNPALRGALAEAMKRVVEPKKRSAPTFKTEKAAKAVAEIGGKALAEKLGAMQEKQIDAIAVEGNWLVLGDRSSSMQAAIETAKVVAATLARAAKGNVWLVFFNASPTFYDVTGKTLEEIKAITAGVVASGNTSIGCGLSYARMKKLEVDGIAIVSDGGENTPPLFPTELECYQRETGREPAVYLYHVPGDANTLDVYMRRAGLHMETFEIGRTVDYYSLPNLIQTMRAKRWSLVDEIMETPLLTLNGVFSRGVANTAA